MFQTEVVQEIKTRISYSTALFRKSCRLWDNVEEHCRAGQATDDNIIRRMRVECYIRKATNTHSEYVILFVHSKNSCTNAPQGYVIRTLNVLFVTNLGVSCEILGFSRDVVKALAVSY
jgi:hypothetical protein